MSVLSDFGGDIPSEDTCPHGEPTDDELACSYCWLEAQSGTMAIDDPRREA